MGATVTASVAGALLLVVIGIAFVSAAVVGWWRVAEDPTQRTRRLTGVLIDLLVGLTALGDGAVSVIDEPERVVVWSVGSAALLLALMVLIARHRRVPPLRS